MARGAFRFKEFSIAQRDGVMPMSTDSVLLGSWARLPEAGRILDLGCGTGVIALMLAQRGARAVDAIDIEAAACRQAQENVAASPWPGAVHIAHRAFQLWAEECAEPYAAIVANPPYFIDSLKSGDASRDYARHAELLSHDDILEGLGLCLAPGGHFSAIFPLREGCLFIVHAAECGWHCNRMVSVVSRAGSPTKRLLCEFSREQIEREEAQLCIYGADGRHSSEFIALTSDFYLYL